jgi:hypothetical protein
MNVIKRWRMKEMAHKPNRSVKQRKPERYCKNCGHKIKKAPGGKGGHSVLPTLKGQKKIKYISPRLKCFCGCDTIE